MKLILKTIINKGASYYADWNYIIDLIKLFKTTIKEMSNNPQDAKDIKTQLEFSLNKNELLETQLIEMEQKIKNIQTAYFDTLKDNEKFLRSIDPRYFNSIEMVRERFTTITHLINDVLNDN